MNSDDDLRQQEEADLLIDIEFLIEIGQWPKGSTQLGVAKQAVAQGIASLSPRQQNIPTP